MPTKFLRKCKAKLRRKSSPKGDYLIKTISQNDRGYFNPNVEDFIILYVINWIKFSVSILMGGGLIV